MRQHSCHYYRATRHETKTRSASPIYLNGASVNPVHLHSHSLEKKCLSKDYESTAQACFRLRLNELSFLFVKFSSRFPLKQKSGFVRSSPERAVILNGLQFL